MTKPAQPDKLQIDADPRFLHRDWQAQRWAWWVFCAVLAAAALGVFGSGPLSSATAGDAEQRVVVEYQRFGRWQAPQTLTITVQQLENASGPIRLWLDQAYVHDLEIQAIVPEPQRQEVSGERIVYEFAAQQPSERQSFTFHVSPQRAGSLRGRAGSGHGHEASFTQFIYP